MDETTEVDARNGLRRVLDRTTYLLVGLPLGIVVFAGTITLIALGVGLLITLLGIPVLVAAAWYARLAATGERLAIRQLLGLEAPAPRYRSEQGHNANLGWFRRQLRVLAGPQTYLEFVWAILMLPLGIFGFVVAVVWWSITLGGLSYPLWSWALPDDRQGLAYLLGFGNSFLFDNLINVGVGLVGLITLPVVLAGACFIRSGFSRALLSGRAFMQSELDAVAGTRDAARSAEDVQLTRLERDIHDGPQQRLVRLKLDLARTQRQLAETDPAAAAQLQAAMNDTQHTLDELRDLSRGIAPQILTREGLAVAVQEAAERCSVATTVSADIPHGPQIYPAHIERTAYFMVTEALTNVAKHSRANCARVRLLPLDDPREPALLVVIADDGIGGARPVEGHGLVGLGERVRSVGGSWDVESPEGGPTTVTSRLPLGK